MKYFRWCLAACAIALFAQSATPATPSAPTLEQRVAARRALEEVYWRHRLWPAENRTPKPSLEAVIPDEAIRAKVEDTLRRSEALERYWGRPVTPAQLQAELDRMIGSTKRPELLHELFAALNDDPVMIAECLVRPALVDRLSRSWYAGDQRFHAEVKGKAEAALVRAARVAGIAGVPGIGAVSGPAGATEGDAMRGIEDLRHSGALYNELTWRSVDDPSGQGAIERPGVANLSPDEFDTLLSNLRTRLAVRDTVTAAQAEVVLPRHRLTPLEEDSESFFVSVVLDQTADSLRTATFVWPKTPFDVWWQGERASLGPVIPASIADYRLSAPAVSGCTDDTWAATLEEAPEPRAQHAAVWTGAEMIVWGGRQAGELNKGDLATGGRYDPATDTWMVMGEGTGAPAPRHGHTMLWTGTEVIVWGGSQGVDAASQLNTGGHYDPATDTWAPTSTGAGVPEPRTGHTGVWTGAEMIIWGGTPDLTTPLDTGGRYDPVTDTWQPTPIDANTPAGRYYHAAVWTGGRMLVWGGAAGPTFLNDGGQYRLAAGVWSPMSTLVNVPSARALPSAVWTGTEMIVWGGTAAGALNTGGRYNPATDSWAPTSTGANVPAPRNLHTALWTGSEMIIWGGKDFAPRDTGGRYSPAGDVWSVVAKSPGFPSARFNHTAVWTGTEMIVWGGDNDQLFLKSGSRYNPGSNTWVAVNEGSTTPQGRRAHTAVWTGTEMIVWGGRGPNIKPLDSGSRYDPATDSWSPTSSGPTTPQRRLLQTAVWTGIEMLVWGGYSGDFLDSGGRYDPLANTWSPMTIDAGTPSPRIDHSSVWTGTEMIVWGGQYEQTGGRYDPIADAWTPTGTGTGVPAGRTNHTAVWTGAEMIVWGGASLLAPKDNSGGRYDPLTDTWTPTSQSAGVPAGRLNHTAVWSGTEMIVWGGSPNIDTGGRYDPSTDAWLPVSEPPNRPEGRGVHGAVWTGSEMIVWGGARSGSSINTGGRYDPSSDTWRLTSGATGVPAPRHLHTGVWTGDDMIVWGGISFTGGRAKQSGGLYCAVAPTP